MTKISQREARRLRKRDSLDDRPRCVFCGDVLTMPNDAESEGLCVWCVADAIDGGANDITK